MTIERHGQHFVFYDDGDALAEMDFGTAAVTDAYFPEGKGYFDNIRLAEYGSAEELAKAVAPVRVPVAQYVPAGYRIFGHYAIRTPSGAVSDLATVFVEQDLKEVKLAFSSRPLKPGDGAITIFTTRRAKPVLAYEAVRTTRTHEDARLTQHPHELIQVGGKDTVLMRFDAGPGGEPLRGRQIPREFVTWYEPLVEGWISVHSSAEVGEIRKIADGIRL